MNPEQISGQKKQLVLDIRTSANELFQLGATDPALQ